MFENENQIVNFDLVTSIYKSHDKLICVNFAGDSFIEIKGVDASRFLEEYRVYKDRKELK